eukprot:636291-Pleurochrysis_carterae.AAC.2
MHVLFPTTRHSSLSEIVAVETLKTFVMESLVDPITSLWSSLFLSRTRRSAGGLTSLRASRVHVVQQPPVLCARDATAAGCRD